MLNQDRLAALHPVLSRATVCHGSRWRAVALSNQTINGLSSLCYWSHVKRLPIAILLSSGISIGLRDDKSRDKTVTRL
jgi:hypothetical protein